MKIKMKEKTDLVDLKNFLDYSETVTEDDDTFQKLMFVYKMAIKELNTKIEIFKEESKLFYDYDLIDHVNTRIKEPDSIIKKMKKKNLELDYKEMINNINDIAGIRVICPLQSDIYTIKNLIQKIPGIETVKEKDYIVNPKESGYTAYHLIVRVPVMLSQELIYVKVEVQIRTMAMDFWSSLEHKMKYKPKEEPTKKQAKEWINCAKTINKLDTKMMLLNS